LSGIAAKEKRKNAAAVGKKFHAARYQEIIFGIGAEKPIWVEGA
jgi:hypothetical protein